MNRLPDISFVIPLRVDFPERIRNILIVLDFINKNFDSEVIVLEADTERRFYPDINNKEIKYLFVEDKHPVFHRTKYLNLLYAMAVNPILAVWDTDMLLPAEQIEEAAQEIRQGKSVIAIPYNGYFYLTSDDLVCRYQALKDFNFLKGNVMNTMNGQLSVGGAFLVDREKYLKAGGENENFTGWGPEDVERLKRMEILYDKPVYQSAGCAYHLWHPRTNSRYVDSQDEIIHKQELLKICQMNKTELRKYIRNHLILNYINIWEWRKK